MEKLKQLLFRAKQGPVTDNSEPFVTEARLVDYEEPAPPNPLQMDAERRLLVVCHQGKRVGNGTAIMENVGGQNMLVAKCEWIRK